MYNPREHQAPNTSATPLLCHQSERVESIRPEIEEA